MKDDLNRVREKKKRQREQKQESKRDQKRQKLDVKKGQTVLDDEVAELQVYRPTTAQTKTIYEKILAALVSQLGDQSPEVLSGAVEEVLAAIKTDDCLDAQRKRNVEEILGPITETFFAELYRLSKQITDYRIDEGKGGDDEGKGAEADATGVAVIFDEEDSDENKEDYVYEMSGDEDSDDDLKEDKERRLLTGADDGRRTFSCVRPKCPGTRTRTMSGEFGLIFRGRRRWFFRRGWVLYSPPHWEVRSHRMHEICRKIVVLRTRPHAIS